MGDYQICKKCIMDTTDSSISFDAHGICSHCHAFEKRSDWLALEERSVQLELMIENIKAAGKNHEYDCMIGLSGGLDSSYLALKASQWGLRPLVFHVDAGWNSELAVANIEKIVTHCNYNLHTCVVDWETMRDLHLAYLKSGISNQDVPQDHIFFASQYHFAMQNNIRFILSGGNLASECVTPDIWHNSSLDAINLKDIHRRFGQGKLENYQTISCFQYYFWYSVVKKMRVYRPLNFIDYNCDMAIKELEDTIGWRSYRRKHGESIFTKIFQNHILPMRFGYDKRKLHYSSLIISGQMNREDAMAKMQEPLYCDKELEEDISYFCKKLRISRDEFNEYMQAPLKHYTDYANWDTQLKLLKTLQSLIKKVTGRRIATYS